MFTTTNKNVALIYARKKILLSSLTKTRGSVKEYFKFLFELFMAFLIAGIGGIMLVTILAVRVISPLLWNIKHQKPKRRYSSFVLLKSNH